MSDELFAPPEAPDHRPRLPRPKTETGDRGPCKEARGDRIHAARPAPYPGPRCATCWRVESGRRKVAQQVAQRERRFGITEEEYQAVYEAQGRACYVCRRATGRRKRLAVEHDHTLAVEHGHPLDEGCAKCLTGLACGPCNQEVLGRIGHRPEAYERIAVILRDPPARHIIQRMRNVAKS